MTFDRHFDRNWVSEVQIKNGFETRFAVVVIIRQLLEQLSKY